MGMVAAETGGSHRGSQPTPTGSREMGMETRAIRQINPTVVDANLLVAVATEMEMEAGTPLRVKRVPVRVRDGAVGVNLPLV